MINLNKVQLKNVKSKIGHEGEPCSYGSIHLANRKVGTFELDTWSGSYVYDVDESAKTKLVNALMESSVMSALREGRDGEHHLYGDVVEHFIALSDELAYFEGRVKAMSTQFKRPAGCLAALNYESSGRNYRGEEMNTFSYDLLNDAVLVWTDEDVAKQSAKFRKETKADLYLLIVPNHASVFPIVC